MRQQTSERTTECEYDYTSEDTFLSVTRYDLEENVPTQRIYPIEHGSACPGHTRRMYSSWRPMGGVLWAPYIPPGQELVRVDEEYL